jgi:hypothetical protein
VTRHGGALYTLVGAGARSYLGYKVYAMGLYLEDAGARREFPRLAGLAGGSDHDSLIRSNLVYNFIVVGAFGKLARLHFVRDVSAKDIRSSYRDALGDAVSAGAPPALRRDAETFLSLFDDVKAGEEVLIDTSADGKVAVEARGKRRAGPTNLRLTHDIWAIWLGDKPIARDLKRRIVDRVEALGR